MSYRGSGGMNGRKIPVNKSRLMKFYIVTDPESTGEQLGRVGFYSSPDGEFNDLVEDGKLHPYIGYMDGHKDEIDEIVVILDPEERYLVDNNGMFILSEGFKKITKILINADYGKWSH